MSFDDDIIIEDKYGTDRNINELLDIDDVNLEQENRKDFSNFLLKDENIKTNKKIDDESFKDENVKKYKDFKLSEDFTNDQKLEKPKVKDTFKWYIKSSIVAMIFITLFSVIIILIKGDIRNNIYGVFRAPFEAIVFLILSSYIVKSKKQVPKISGITCAFAGFFSGIFISLFKLFYHMELWTVFNLASESLFLLLEGLALGLIFGAILYSVDDSLKNKNYE